MKPRLYAAVTAALAAIAVVSAPAAHASDQNGLACRGGYSTPGTDPAPIDKNGVQLDACLEIQNNQIVAMRAYTFTTSGHAVELVLRLMEDPWKSGHLVRISWNRSGQTINGKDTYRSALGPIEHGTYYLASAGYILNGVEYDDVQSQVLWQP
ncbi:hypothetical protein [Streptomyces sp. NPDC020667]|uniref:hypothetical protein n=1 Tax=Streptomyces sp. NPDC020667 TaxID=3154895 RepID=UPI0033D2AE48